MLHILGALTLLAFLTAGCVSSTTIKETSDFGVSRLSVDTPDGMKVRLDLGKEYDSFYGSLKWVDGKPEVSVTAIGARGFEGQALASSVAVEVQRQLTERVELGAELTAELASSITKAVLGSALLPALPSLLPHQEVAP